MGADAPRHPRAPWIDLECDVQPVLTLGECPLVFRWFVKHHSVQGLRPEQEKRISGDQKITQPLELFGRTWCQWEGFGQTYEGQPIRREPPQTKFSPISLDLAAFITELRFTALPSSSTDEP